MEILALAILILCSLTGFVAIFFTTFGTLIILIGSILYAGLTGFTTLSFKQLFILFCLYIFGEIMEYVSVILGTKKFGASNAAIFGALVGGILGAVLGISFFGIGIIPGTFAGVFTGAFIVELVLKRDFIKSLKAGTGGVLGRVGSIFLKVIVAIIMYVIIGSGITNR